MLMRPELPIKHSRRNDILVKELLMIAIFGVIGVAAALGISITFPTSAEWIAQFAG